MRAASQIASDNGTADLTLDESNEEISKARKHKPDNTMIHRNLRWKSSKN